MVPWAGIHAPEHVLTNNNELSLFPLYFQIWGNRQAWLEDELCTNLNEIDLLNLFDNLFFILNLLCPRFPAVYKGKLVHGPEILKRRTGHHEATLWCHINCSMTLNLCLTSPLSTRPLFPSDRTFNQSLTHTTHSTAPWLARGSPLCPAWYHPNPSTCVRRS